MFLSVRIRRLSAATLVCASIVLGLSFLMGSGRAASKPASGGAHTCTLIDQQFLGSVQTNMQQLSMWSDELVAGDADAGTVVKQIDNEEQQIAGLVPTDPSLQTSRSLLRKMSQEYALAVQAKGAGKSPGSHIRVAYQMANDVHELLVQAQPGMTEKGCDLTPLLQA
jgi:hypothetical protein